MSGLYAENSTTLLEYVSSLQRGTLIAGPICMNPYLKLGQYAGRVTVIAVVAAVVMFALLYMHGAPLRSKVDQTKRGIVALEFCGTSTKANRVLDAWSKSDNTPDPAKKLTQVAVADIYCDFPFIAAYSVAIMLICGKVATLTTGRWSKATLTLGWSMLLAGGFDVVENIGMLVMLQAGHVESNLLPGITTISAAIKFLLIGAALGTAILSIAIARKA